MPDTLTQLSETQLISLAAAGDARAQAELVDTHLPRIFALAMRTLRDAALAEDIAQETFLRAWKVLPRWKPNARLSTWLHTVALNLCRDHLRKRREVLSDEVPEMIDTALRPDEELDQRERAMALQIAINALPDRQSEALTLCALEGHTNIDAAEIMGCSIDALESLLARARRTLRTQFLVTNGPQTYG